MNGSTWTGFRTIVILLIALAWFVSPVEAKRKRRSYSAPPLKIIDISTSPIPFAPGNEPLAITVEVELPKNLNGADLLEVSSLISFPTKRSIRFLFNRQSVETASRNGGKPRISTTLLWDGKDQTDQFVEEGTYKYEIRAKLMTDGDGAPRTKMVSLKARGELEVSSPEEITRSEAHLEHVPFISDETPPEEIEEGSSGLATGDEEETEASSEEIVSEPFIGGENSP